MIDKPGVMIEDSREVSRGEGYIQRKGGDNFAALLKRYFCQLEHSTFLKLSYLLYDN